MKKEIYFVTGNKGKAEHFSKCLGIDLKQKSADLEEIQSMDLKEIVNKKLEAAFEQINSPVIVEDVSLEFESLGGLPGPFIKFFVDNMDLGDICELVNGKSREATARCVFGYYDGENKEFFEDSLRGQVSTEPRGDNGFGWDKIFEPEDFEGRTRAELNDVEYQKSYMDVKPFKSLESFLNNLN